MLKKLLGKIALRKSNAVKLVTEPEQQQSVKDEYTRETEKSWTISAFTVEDHLITSLLKLSLVMLIASGSRPDIK
jgi:hypothetical protein